MQEEIEYYRRECERTEEYIETIEALEVELRVMQEAKERDERLIQYKPTYIEIWHLSWETSKEIALGEVLFLVPRCLSPLLMLLSVGYTHQKCNVTIEAHADHTFINILFKFE